jgi:hypothetical protein
MTDQRLNGAREAAGPAEEPPVPDEQVPAEAVTVGGETIDADTEVVDGVPVLAAVRPLERASPVSLPAVQAAAVAGAGFVAGAATFALVRHRAARKAARGARSAPRRAADMLPIVATRSFLVDVHVIAKNAD